MKKCTFILFFVFLLHVWATGAHVKNTDQPKKGTWDFKLKKEWDIETLGEKNVKQLVSRDLVSDISDLYHLQVEDLKKLEGFAEKSAEKLYQAIQDTKNPPLDRFIYALGIRHVGRHIARVLTHSFGNLDELMKAETSDLEEINEIGPEIAQRIYSFFQEEKNMDILKRLKKVGVQVQAIQKKKKSQKKTKTGGMN